MATSQLKQQVFPVKDIPYTVFFERQPADPQGPCATCGAPAKVAMQPVVKEIHNPQAPVKQMSLNSPTSKFIIQNLRNKILKESAACERCHQ